tara:strand:- start:14 stop:283 length:270 start_codon:yes stop_codon:yes gene_type:complete
MRTVTNTTVPNVSKSVKTIPAITSATRDMMIARGGSTEANFSLPLESKFPNDGVGWSVGCTVGLGVGSNVVALDDVVHTTGSAAIPVWS